MGAAAASYLIRRIRRRLCLRCGASLRTVDGELRLPAVLLNAAPKRLGPLLNVLVAPGRVGLGPSPPARRHTPIAVCIDSSIGAGTHKPCSRALVAPFAQHPIVHWVGIVIWGDHRRPTFLPIISTGLFRVYWAFPSCVTGGGHATAVRPASCPPWFPPR